MKLALIFALATNVFLQAPSGQQEAARRGDQATIIDDTWYVASDTGGLIRVAGKGHCSEGSIAPDEQTMFCRVASPPAPDQMYAPTLELDVYRRNGVTIAIKPGGEIGEWRLQNGGAQVAIDVYQDEKLIRHDLYDATTGAVVERVEQPADKSTLPKWAKSQSQLLDESVPESDALNQERTQWIAKVINQIAQIQPGMTRADVLRVMTTEGGLSTRTERTYVYPGCPYIKVRIRFKPVGATGQVSGEPNDQVVSVSQPYLEYSILD